MKKRYLLLIFSALTISIVSLSIAVVLLWKNIELEKPPSGIKEVEVTKGESTKVTIDSTDYYFTLNYFTDYSEVIQMKVAMSSGYQIRNLYFNKYSTFYDFKVILKERLSNSVIVWIEKTE